MKRGLVDAAPPKTLWFPIAIASDEVWVVAMSYFIFHLPALLFMFFVILSTLDILKVYECDIVDEIIEGPHKLFNILTFAHLLISHLLWLWAFYVSSRGDIFEGHKRKHINIPISALLIHDLLMIPLFLLGLAALGTFEYEALDLDFQQCNKYSESQLILLVFILISMLLDIIAFIICAFTLVDFFGNESKRRRRRSSSADTEAEFTDRKDFWNKRCRTWCFTMKLLSCGCFGGVKKGEQGEFAFNQISDVFGTWFTGHDSGLSDLITALLLLRAEQLSKNRKELVKIYKSSSKDFDHDRTKKKNLSAELVDFLETEDTVRKFRRRVGSVYRNIFEEEAAAEVEDVVERRSTVKRKESVDLKKEAKQKIKEVGVMPHFEVKRTALELEISEKNLFLLKLFSDYRSYMMGLYGWKLLVYMDTISLRPLRNIGKILGFSKPASPKKLFFRDQTAPKKQKCCSSNANALMAQTNLVSEHLVYASYASVEGLVVPFAVMIDHDMKSVIVGCRGTMSLNDLITDAMIHPAPLKTLGERWNFEGKDRYAHHGMLSCAVEIRKQLQKTQILHRLLKKEVKSDVEDDVDDEELLKNLNVKLEDLPDCSGYNLVVLGHSLGGGVASLLALLLKNEFDLEASTEPPKEGEELENRFFCLAYAAPGCVMDEMLSQECESFIVSPVIGVDLVPHLSWLTLQKLRLKSLDALYRSRASRKDIFATMYRHIPNAKLFYSRKDVPNTPARNKLKKQIEKLARRVLLVEEGPAAVKEAEEEGEVGADEELDKTLIERKVMQCPGRVIHFASLFSKPKKCSLLSREKEHKVYNVEKDDFIDLSVSLRLVLDHFPNYYSEVIEQTYKQFREEFDGDVTEKKFSVSLSVDGKTI